MTAVLANMHRFMRIRSWLVTGFQTPDSSRRGFTLVEMLVVISIITLLAAILLPALSMARDNARRTQCQSNLREFGIGMHAYAQGHESAFCSGNFDWARDGAVTEIGWVADLVNNGVLVGKMNCPSNEGQVSEAYDFLLGANASGFLTDTCVNRPGSAPRLLPDGTLQRNPCREIIENGALAGGPSEARRALIDTKVFQKGYNTNYTASWFLVRGGVILDASGNPKAAYAGCAAPADLTNRTYCLGPLKQSFLDSSRAPGMLVPLLGDGGIAGVGLSAPLGDLSSGSVLVKSMTGGPRLKDVGSGSNYLLPSFAGGTPRNGPSGWWKVWNRDVLQDYRNFQPVHRGVANILFADGSVRTYTDGNDDGQLNNGFVASPSGGGFANDELELKQDDIFSLYSLDALRGL